MEAEVALFIDPTATQKRDFAKNVSQMFTAETLQTVMQYVGEAQVIVLKFFLNLSHIFLETCQSPNSDGSFERCDYTVNVCYEIVGRCIDRCSRNDPSITPWFFPR